MNVLKLSKSIDKLIWSYSSLGVKLYRRKLLVKFVYVFSMSKLTILSISLKINFWSACTLIIIVEPKNISMSLEIRMDINSVHVVVSDVSANHSIASPACRTLNYYNYFWLCSFFFLVFFRIKCNQMFF